MSSKIKTFIISLLVILACLFTGLGINGFIKAPTETAVAAESNKMLAWYKFDKPDTANIDATGNYNLTKHSSFTTLPSDYERGDGIAFPYGSGNCMMYASTAEQNPLSYFSGKSGADLCFTISLLYYTGECPGGANRIIAGNTGWAGFSVWQNYGDIAFCFDDAFVNYGKFYLGSNKWVRLTLQYNGTQLIATCRNVTNRKYVTGTYLIRQGDKGVDGDTSYDENGRLIWNTDSYGFGIANFATAFVIGNKGNLGFTSGNDAGMISDFGQKIADLRIYSHVIDTYEYARIFFGDDVRADTWAITQYSYRPFGNKDVTLDVTQEASQRNTMNQLTPGAITYDENDMATVFSGANGLLYARNHGYINAKTGATINNDFSDYMRKAPFSFSARVKLTSGRIDPNTKTNYPYYVFTTGMYGSAFALAVSANNIDIYLGKGYNISTYTESEYNTTLRLLTF